MALLLLDRDGVLNCDRPQSVRRPDELELLPGAAAAVARLNVAGVRVAVITNQSIVGRGIIDEVEMARIHAHLDELLAQAGGAIDAYFVAPDPPDAPTPRRKPGPAMLIEALTRFGEAASTTPFVGDYLTDLQAAATAGCPRVLVRTGGGTAVEAAGFPACVLPVRVFDDLAQAVGDYLGRRGAP